METVIFQQDIPTLRVAATSFPSGVMEAFSTLHGILPAKEGRQTFGISHGGTEGEMLYWAATNVLNEAAEKEAGFEPFIIRKGAYASILVQDFYKDMSAIGRTFQTLLAHPDLDPEGYCLEIYQSEKDVQCLVKLKD